MNTPVDGAKLPDAFLRSIDGVPMLEGLAQALMQQPVVSVRLNSRKAPMAVPAGEAVPWCTTGRYLESRQPFTFDPAMHQGRYYVQDASSMILRTVVGKLSADMDAPLYLDACAAPGGKTTAAIDALPDSAVVVANEYMPARAVALRENVIKWGFPGVIVSRGDTCRLSRLEGLFDIVATDVPCSGEGMMRKDAEAVAQWSPALVDECVARQQEIVRNVWPSIKPGGYLIYSTCTFNRRENEEMVQHIVDQYGAETVDMDFPAEWGIDRGIDTLYHCYRFLPHHLKGEGLFLAVLRKPEREDEPSGLSRFEKKSGKGRLRQGAKAQKVPVEVAGWLDDGRQWNFETDNGCVTAFPACGGDVLRLARQALDVVHYGIELATAKGRDRMPSQSLAMSTALADGAFHRHEVDYATAIAYLRHEAVALDNAPRGYVLLTYGNHPLGFVKNIGNRANNLYPAPWRILSSYMPSERPEILK